MYEGESVYERSMAADRQVGGQYANMQVLL